MGKIMFAVLLMLFSVLSWSLYPLAAALGTEKISITAFLFFTELASLASTFVIYKYMTAKHKVTPPGFFDFSKKERIEIFISAATMNLSLLCLLASMKFMMRGGAVLIFETWPVISLYLTPILIQKGWSKISIRDLVFGIFTIVGIGYIIHTDIARSYGEDAHNISLYAKHLLPFLGGVFMAISSLTKARTSKNVKLGKSPLLSPLYIQYILCIIKLIILLPFVMLMNDAPSTFSADVILIVLGVGMITFTLGNMFYTMAVLNSKKSTIIALWYLMPVLAVFWLWVSGMTEIGQEIILGSIFIISANLLITVKADNNKAYNATIVSLILSGVFCLYVPGKGMDSYFDAISVTTVFYVIVAAFMMDRLIKRDTMEEEMAVSIIHTISTIKKLSQKKADNLIDNVLKIVSTSDKVEINASYMKLRNTKDVDLSDAHENLDKLALSKAHSTNFGELCVLFLIGLLAIIIALLFRPYNLESDIVGMVLSTTVIFLLFNILDLNKDRSRFYLELKSKKPCRIKPEVIADSRSEQVLSMVLICVILAAFAALFIQKYAS